MTLFAANAGDWISVIIPIVVAIIWVLNQVIGRLAQPQNPRDLRRPAQPPPVRPQQAKVEEEIEAFLRRAAQQRGAGQKPAPATVPQPAAPRTLVQRAEPISASRRMPTDAVVQVEMVDEEGPADTRSVSVAEHVKRHLDTSDFRQRASSISSVDQADEQLAQRLHQAFDHQVGTLETKQEVQQKAAAAAAATATRITASGVHALLRDASSLRNAIILQEILRRPDER